MRKTTILSGAMIIAAGVGSAADGASFADPATQVGAAAAPDAALRAVIDLDEDVRILGGARFKVADTVCAGTDCDRPAPMMKGNTKVMQPNAVRRAPARAAQPKPGGSVACCTVYPCKPNPVQQRQLQR